MTRYICLINFTEKGAREIKQSPVRASAFTEAATTAGVNIDAQYWTFGRFDGVLILSADRAESALHYVAELVGAGYVTTETLRAFDQSEIDGIIGA